MVSENDKTREGKVRLKNKHERGKGEARRQQKGKVKEEKKREE